MPIIIIITSISAFITWLIQDKQTEDRETDSTVSVAAVHGGFVFLLFSVADQSQVVLVF